MDFKKHNQRNGVEHRSRYKITSTTHGWEFSYYMEES